MNFRQVYTLGETVYDIIFRYETPVAAKPGGAMLNTSVSLGRTGVAVNFISDFGEDRAGVIISDFLEKNHVSTRYIHRYRDGKTALALAFLDAKSDAEYSFYKIFPEERLNIELPVTGPEDILLFGSFYAITAELRERVRSFVNRARQAGTLIIYDPNFRKPHLSELEKVRPWICENISMADIIRGSDEDFAMIFGAADPESAYRFVQEAGCSNMICTRNSESTVINTGSVHVEVPAQIIQPVSTIGAGDAFNAGIIWSLVSEDISREELTSLTARQWLGMARTAMKFSTDVCMQFDNYVSADFHKQLE